MKCNDTLLSSPPFGGGAVRIALDYAKIGKSGFKPFYPSTQSGLASPPSTLSEYRTEGSAK